jgi:hypothetical protein
VHLPELTLAACCFGSLRGVHRMRVRRFDREVPEHETGAAAEALEHELDRWRSLLAGRALEIAVLDDGHRRMLGAERVIGGADRNCEIDRVAAHGPTLLARQIENQNFGLASVA